MKTALVVSSDVETPETIRWYETQGKLSTHRYIYLIEHFDKTAHLDADVQTYIVEDFSDPIALAKAFERIATERKIDTVISIDEFSVYVAALAREALGLTGLNTEHARKFRDKVVMKEALHGSLVNVPTVYSLAALRTGDIEFPLVIKPRSLAGAVGVSIIEDEDELAALTTDLSLLGQDGDYVDMSEAYRQVEQFIAGDVYHIDGIAQDGVVVASILSRYLSTPLMYLSGHPLGSITVPASDASHWHTDLTAEVIRRLDVPDGAFHLEVIKHEHGQPYFLEIGIRPGGAQVKRVFSAITGVDLLLGHVRMQLGLDLLPADAASCRHAGWLIFPKRHDLPDGHVVRDIQMPRATPTSTLLHRFVPHIGAPASGPFYSHDRTLGTFVFCGDRASVGADIASFMQHYKVGVSAFVSTIANAS